MFRCANVVKLSKEVCKFMETDPNEESITDYIFWQFNELNLVSDSLNIKKFNRVEENQTYGADFEIVFMDRNKNKAITLLFQAKIAKKEYDDYKKKLNHNNGQQLQTLLNHAKNNRKIPFYIFYSNYDPRIISKCEYLCNPSYIFSFNFCHCITKVHAYEIEQILKNEGNKGKLKNKGNKGKGISKYNILKKGNPFSCLFCCPIATGYNPDPIEHLFEYLTKYFDDIKRYDRDEYITEIPKYISEIEELKRKLENIDNNKEYTNEGKHNELMNVLKKYKLTTEIKTEKGKQTIPITKYILAIDLTRND